MIYRVCGLLMLLGFLALISPSVHAQTDASVDIWTLDSSNFPSIQVHFIPLDEEGRFVHGLEAGDVRVLEDEISISPISLSELHPGLQLAIALNPGRTFSIRDSQGVSRYQYLVNDLKSWLTHRLGSTLDDLSLLDTEGMRISHVNDPASLLPALEDIDTESARELQPDLNVLSNAIDLTADVPRRIGMGRAVLFITTPLDEQYDIALQDLTSRAQQSGVKVFVWMVASQDGYTQQALDRLGSIAQQTGGQLFIYTGEEPYPDPEIYLGPLRNIYELTYDSRVRESGTHQVEIEVGSLEGEISSPPRAFDIDIQPPDPAFVSPPLEIRRVPPLDVEGKPDKNAELSSYTPEEQEIQILVSFPDENVRPILRTTLLVNGEIVIENRQAPFDRFIWDLREYTSSESYVLQIEAEDSLGLVGSSIENLVQINVVTPSSSPWSWLYQNALILSGLAVVLAGAILLLVLIVGGRLKPSALSALKRGRQKTDPVTQPVFMQQELSAQRSTSLVNRLHWPKRKVETRAPAFLTRLANENQENTATPIPLTATEIKLGSDPTWATLVLNDPSVSPKHACLSHHPDNSFWLADEDSVAGTWINYTPVSTGGSRLEHGDLIHVGRTMFRFTLRKPIRVRKPVITLIEQDEGPSD